MSPTATLTLPELVALANRAGLREVPYSTAAAWVASGFVPGIERASRNYFVRQENAEAAIAALLERSYGVRRSSAIAP